MNSHLGKRGRSHDIDVDETLQALHRLPDARLVHPAGHVILWRVGDLVSMLTADNQRCRGTVRLVDTTFKSVVIEVHA